MHVIDQVAHKIEAGERLSEADALALFETPELVEIGRLADLVNRKKNHGNVFFNVNRHINPTNICALSCKFCAYSRKPGEEGAYAYSIDEMVKKAGEAVAHGATEVHMVGGLHPRWNFQYYKDMIAAVKNAFPQIHIKAFTAVEFDWLARKSRKTIQQVMEELREVGLGSIPGGGAEIFDPEVRDAICETKVSAEQWLDTHRTAHRLGMKSNSTMLYGHIEKYVHRVDHMRRLRELQDETHGFNAFIPLSFQPFQNEMGIDRYTFGYDDLKTLAVARLFLDNFQHVKAYWIMLGQDVAQMALQYGANDLDGTIIEEKISRMAGGRSGMSMNRGFIEKIIRKADREPVERDTLYNALAPMRQGAVAAPAADVDAILARHAASTEVLAQDELVTLAEGAPLHALAKLAQHHSRRLADGQASFVPVVTVPMKGVAAPAEAIALIQGRVDACRETYKLTPTQITLDLTGIEPDVDGDIGTILSTIFAVRHSFADFEIALAGLRALWRVAQGADVTVDELLAKLAEAGVDSVESSGGEGETDLTHGEVTDIHRHVHQAGLPTIAKAELVAPADGHGTPLWDSFIRRIKALGELAEVPGSELNGISIEVSAGSLVTGIEYMRAVAIARLAAPQGTLIITPLARIPTISPAQGLGTASYQHPAEKIAALCLHHGAGDLGPIDIERLSPVAVMRQIRSAGFTPVLRDRQQAPLNRHHVDEMLVSVIGDTRHVPPSTLKQV